MLGSVGTEVMPERYDTIAIKLSVSRSTRIYSSPLLVRRTNQQHRFVWAAPDASESRPGPSRKAHNGRAADRLSTQRRAAPSEAPSRSVGCSPDKPMMLISMRSGRLSSSYHDKAEDFSR